MKASQLMWRLAGTGIGFTTVGDNERHALVISIPKTVNSNVQRSYSRRRTYYGKGYI
jgi:hypothetical protein